MDAAAHDRASRAAAEVLVAAAAGDLDLPVPSCPGWVLADLLFHAGNALVFWGVIAAGTPPREVERPVRPDASELAAWLRTELDRHLTDLAARDPAAEAWSFTDDHTVGWIQRRMTQELAVHAWDATNALGSPQALDPEVAIDGVDEFFEVWLGSNPEYLAGPRQSIHLHATDVAGEWLVSVGEGDLVVTREHAKGDVALRGPASDLLLVLWGRVVASDSIDASSTDATSTDATDPSGVVLFGDRAELDRFLARTAT